MSDLTASDSMAHSSATQRGVQDLRTHLKLSSGRWLYAFIGLPVLTDLIETGALPRSPREWLTEVVAGLVIATLVHKLRKEQQALMALARTDALTTLWNRAAFSDAIEDECARARRSDRALSLVYIDVDHFKQVNDRHGHARGDQILQQLAAAILRTLRARVDRGFRIGGDEFALLLPDSTAAQAEHVVTRICAHCEQFESVFSDTVVSLSAGIVELEAKETAAEFVWRADAAMYRKKSSGHRMRLKS